MAFVRGGYVHKSKGKGNQAHHSHIQMDKVSKNHHDYNFHIKHYDSGLHVYLGKKISFPKKYLGKRIRLKVEVVKDGGMSKV